MVKFFKAYVKSMRLYYSFVTGIAGWIGVAYYEFLVKSASEHSIEIAPTPEKKLVILFLLFLSWGINQIINDYLGLKEDRINAPDRPMVTGELNPRLALLLSIGLLCLSAGITWFYLEPAAIIFLIAGVLLNVLYEWAKGHGILGNIVFGLMISMATLYGAYAAGPTTNTFLALHRLSGIILVWVINGLMTFYTYFKDYRGDRAAGKETIIVKYKLHVSKVLSIVFAFLPTIIFLSFHFSGMLWVNLNPTFIILGVLTVFLQLWTGILYYKNPYGEKTYTSLKTNFRACTCGEATIIALFNPDLAIWLFIMSYIFVGFLFDLHKNPKS
ncbi:UbiA family prenyltransferase [Candidatus Dependentiae bacterium]|nr:UbiA family prenyltransferase [Candidatus Dependentiae bacterium]